MRRKRQLSSEERALWDLVAERTIPMHNRPVRHEPAPMPKPSVRDPVLPEPAAIPAFRVGQKATPHRPHEIAAPVAEELTQAPLRMDKRAHGRLTKGRIEPEGRIDLHGMTLSEAHPELISFILSAHASGKRLVLVITGKGKDRDEGGPIPTRLGVLRHQVPQWLRLPPLMQAVLQVVPAHIRHGGHGAYYVYLRRGR